MAETFQTPRGPVVVNEPFYLASCDKCGWIGSSEQCGTDCWGDDSDVYCPECYVVGCDCGTVAAEIERKARADRPVTDPTDGGAG